MKRKKEGFIYYVAAKLEEDTKRWKDDGKNNIDACSCAHFQYFELKFERKKVLQKNNLVYNTRHSCWLIKTREEWFHL